MEEIWKDVIGFEGYYQVSNLGNVRSRYKILSQQLAFANYYKVDFKLNGIRKTIAVHRLVATAFIPNPENKPTVNHIDGIKTNNNVINLEWATYSENNKHAVDNKLRQSPWIGKYGIDNPRSKIVQQYNLNNELITEYPNARIAATKITGINYKHISSCCLGKRKTHGGFIWKYKV